MDFTADPMWFWTDNADPNDHAIKFAASGVAKYYALSGAAATKIERLAVGAPDREYQCIRALE